MLSVSPSQPDHIAIVLWVPAFVGTTGKQMFVVTNKSPARSRAFCIQAQT
jgi:hypothetical protein